MKTTDIRPDLNRPELPPSDFMLGNYYIGYDDKLHQVDLQFFVNIDNGVEVNEMVKAPLPLTEELLLQSGFESHQHFTVMNSKFFDLGRNRQITIGCIGTPNEMVFLQQIDVDKRTINDLICFRNFDYDGRTYFHHVQNICAMFGKELIAAGYCLLRKGGEGE